MREEFHADNNGAKQLYGWGSINANIWLPSLSELVGTTGNQNATTGCYYPAMQGLNFSLSALIDKKGGSQWALISPRNADGGGAFVSALCGDETAWTRSPDYNHTIYSYAFGVNNALRFLLSTASLAVHPAGDRKYSLKPSAAKTCSLHCISFSHKAGFAENFSLFSLLFLSIFPYFTVLMGNCSKSLRFYRKHIGFILFLLCFDSF